MGVRGRNATACLWFSAGFCRRDLIGILYGSGIFPLCFAGVSGRCFLSEEMTSLAADSGSSFGVPFFFFCGSA